MTTITILATSDLHGFLPDTLADVPATRPPRTPTRPAYSPHTPPSG